MGWISVCLPRGECADVSSLLYLLELLCCNAYGCAKIVDGGVGEGSGSAVKLVLYNKRATPSLNVRRQANQGRLTRACDVTGPGKRYEFVQVLSGRIALRVGDKELRSDKTIVCRSIQTLSVKTLPTLIRFS